jgi:hypothetical protein
MDVKEAITQLTGLKKYCEGMAECDESGSYVFDLDVQALDMAITALSPPNEPLTQADLDSMDYDKVWIDYGDDGEWALVVSGRIYSLAVLEGAGFEDILRDEVDGETMDRPSGDYAVYRRPPEGEENT